MNIYFLCIETPVVVCVGRSRLEGLVWAFWEGGFVTVEVDNYGQLVNFWLNAAKDVESNVKWAFWF